MIFFFSALYAETNSFMENYMIVDLPGSMCDAQVRNGFMTTLQSRQRRKPKCHMSDNASTLNMYMDSPSSMSSAYMIGMRSVAD